MNSSKILKKLQKYEDLYDYLSINTGMTIKDPDDVQSIYSTLKAEVINRKTFNMVYYVNIIVLKLKSFFKTVKIHIH